MIHPMTKYSLWGREDQSHSSIQAFLDMYFMLDNMLGGEISDMVLALRDHRLETT